MQKSRPLPIENYTIKPSGILYEFYLSGDVLSPEYYVEWFTIIRNASEDDTIRIYINSPGGDLHTAIQFLRVLGESKAHVITSAEGACMSAATLIFLSGDTVEVTNHCLFMFHNYSGGSIGKGGELYEQAIFERNWSLKLFTQMYHGFLTDQEISAMLDGKDVWLTSDEVTQRITELRKKHKIQQAIEDCEEDDECQSLLEE